MIENDFKAFSSFPNPSPQLDSNLVNLTSNSINSSSSENIHDRIKREKRRSSKPIMKTLSVSTPHSIGSSSPPFLNQRKMSFNRPIGLRTMSSAHELGRRSLDENELNFEVWLKEINKRFRRSDELLKEISIGLNRSTHDLMSNQTERIEFEKDLVGFKGLSKSDLSEEEERIEVEVKKEEVVEANEGLNRGHSRDSCGTTGCEIQAEDFIPQANESDQQNLITSSQLKLIQECVLKDEAGGSIRFKDLLWKSHRTIVIFIRFFWCALCQTYVHQLSQTFFHGSEAAEKLELSLTRIVLIGTGDWRMIKAYREMLKCPFEIYVDSSSKKSLFKQVGLQRTFKSGKSEEKGEYLRDVNLSKIITQSILNIKKMPFRNPGLFTQLGGEFCFELDSKLDPSNLISSSASIRIKKKRFSHLSLRPKPKLQIDHSISSDSHYQKTHDLMDPLVRCVYANRMTNSRDHGSLQKLFDSLGLRILD
ncbi:hypothetical protein DFH28DRAFT_969733 [Melampsora americana]|nr:hypothetical protein DFH28DRAFT_969733 [Melampsora americana]